MDLADEFADRFGRPPAVVSSAPGRVNLIGEHLDYNGGRSLPFPLTCRTQVAAAARDDDVLAVESVQQEGRLELRDLAPPGEGWGAYVGGVVWALGLAGSGFDVLVDGRVPLGSGLSSSAALECAVALAVDTIAGRSTPREELVAACVRAENEYVGAATGAMDQTVALLSEPDHALFIDFATGERRQVPWQPPHHVLVVDTRASHALADGAYGERRRTCEAAAERLGLRWLAQATSDDVARLEDDLERRRARHVVTEMERVAAAVAALESGDWEGLGALLTASHVSLRDDYEVSAPELDVAVDAALAAGALGARMTGGGFGGSALALVPLEREPAVRAAVTDAFVQHGFDPPALVDGTPGAPASVDRRS